MILCPLAERRGHPELTRSGDLTNIKLQNDLTLAANKLASVYLQLNHTADATALTQKVADFLLPFRAGNK